MDKTSRQEEIERVAAIILAALAAGSVMGCSEEKTVTKQKLIHILMVIGK